MHHATNEQETFSGKQVASVLMGSKEEIIPSYFQQEVVTAQDNLDIANSTNESINLPPILMHLYNGDARSDSCIPNINFLTLDIASTL